MHIALSVLKVLRLLRYCYIISSLNSIKNHGSNEGYYFGTVFILVFKFKINSHNL